MAVHPSTFLGLDLSLTQTGIVVTNKAHDIIFQGVIKSSRDGNRPRDELLRLLKIVSKIEDHLILYKHGDIKMAAIEGLAFGIQKTTALAQLSALNYFVRDLLRRWKIPYVIVAPTTLKKFITGSGRAGKVEMMYETFQNYGKDFHNDNICDAFGLSLIARHSFDQGDLTEDQIYAINNLRQQL